jgi:hypothetical protein
MFTTIWELSRIIFYFLHFKMVPGRLRTREWMHPFCSPMYIEQSCQMAYFQTQNPNLGKFWRDLKWNMLVYILYGHLVYFVASRFILWFLVYFFPFRYVVPRIIWHRTRHKNSGINFVRSFQKMRKNDVSDFLCWKLRCCFLRNEIFCTYSVYEGVWGTRP